MKCSHTKGDKFVMQCTAEAMFEVRFPYVVIEAQDKAYCWAHLSKHLYHKCKVRFIGDDNWREVKV